jgi:hypothetical protein
LQRPDIPDDTNQYIDRLKAQIDTAIQNFYQYGKGVVSISVDDQWAHYVITEALRSYLYKESGRDPAEVTFSYSNGGDAKGPIRLYAVERRSPQPGKETLRVGMINMRHPAMDHIVDTSWLLNNEIPVIGTTYADRDNYCYQRAREFLKPLSKKRIECVHLFQTGYQPAVLGFYRALIDHLLTGVELALTPYYFDPERMYYWEGEQWN